VSVAYLTPTGGAAPSAPTDQGSSDTSPLARRLEAAREVVERQFYEAGEVLGRTVEDVGRLIASLDRLAKVMDAGMVEATSLELNGAADNLLALPERQANRSLTIGRMQEIGGSLGDSVNEMRRTLAYLRMFAINIRITAGGIREAGEAFGQFAQEIHDRIELGQRQLNRFDIELGGLREELETALDHELALSTHCESVLPVVPDGLRRSAEEVLAHQRRLLDVMVEVGGLARSVQRKIGSALAALQVGDSTRQRIEHVQQAMSLSRAVSDLPAGRGAQFERLIHGLLAAQLGDAARVFHGDVAKIHDSLAGLATDAGELLRLRDFALARAQGGGEGFLRQMEGHVVHAVDLVERLSLSERAAGEVGASAASAAGRLSEQIISLERIKTDVQQMALNTTLRCSRIGETGKPLAVIAVELRLQAGHMETFAQAALSHLGRLTEDAGSLAAGDSHLDPLTAGASLTDASARLRHAGDAAEADLATVASLGEQIVTALQRAQVQLDFHRTIGAALDEAGEAMADLAGGDPPDTEGLGDILPPLLDRIARSYTMASEREVHQTFTRALGMDAAHVAPEVAQTGQSAEADLEDLLF